MRKLFLIIFWIFIIAMNLDNTANGQTSNREDWTMEKSKTWFEKGEWKNGWKIKVYSDLDVQEFACQYHKNKKLWDMAFSYLNNTKLDTLSPGKHVLDGDNLFVSVSEGPVKDLDAVRWEAHRKYIDIQYVISGKEKMGVAPVGKAVIGDPFDITKDIAFYAVEESNAKYYEANPNIFMIFFPKEAHRPGIKIQGCDTDKKLVVKIIAD